MASFELDLAIAEQVLGTLQQHRSRDRVEIVVDLGLGWDSVEPTLNALVRDGYVQTHLIGDEPVFELTSVGASQSPAQIAVP